MVIKKVSTYWWMLTSDDGLVKLTWFGQTKKEVLGRFRAYIRFIELNKIRYQPKGQ